MLIFRSPLQTKSYQRIILLYQYDLILNKDKKSNAGAKPYDVVMMFKIMILQRYYGLGDTQIEYQIHDRLSFKKFLCLESGDKVPDALH